MSTGSLGVNMDSSQPSLMDITPSLDGKLAHLTASYLEVCLHPTYDSAVVSYLRDKMIPTYQGCGLFVILRDKKKMAFCNDSAAAKSYL